MKTLVGGRKEEGIVILSFETEKWQLFVLRILETGLQNVRTIFAIKALWECTVFFDLKQLCLSWVPNTEFY